jgi:CheY-like chemotaxis protein
VKPSDISTWNVVVIDDEPHNAGVLRIVFDFYKVPFRSAESGMQGIELLGTERPSFLLLDISMPQMSGYDVLREIRANEKLSDLCVIALTAHAMTGDKERIIEAGFDGYIAKPISPINIVSEIMQILESHLKGV